MNFYPDKKEIFNFFLAFFVFLSTFYIASLFTTIGVDPHHDGIILKTAIDTVNGKVVFKETYAQYGALLPLLQASTLKIFGNYLLTLRIQTAFLYGLIFMVMFLLLSKFIPKILAVFLYFIWFFNAPFFPVRFSSLAIGICSILSNICCLFFYFIFEK